MMMRMMMIIFVTYPFFPFDDGVDDDDMCTRLLMIYNMCRNQKIFWEKIRFDETAAAFGIQKEKK